jgi:hypothetical protein
MPSYDSQGRLKVFNSNVSSGSVSPSEIQIESYSGFAAGAAAGDRDFYLASSDLLNVPSYTISALVKVFGFDGNQYIAGSSSEFAEGNLLALVNGDLCRITLQDSTGAGVTVDWFEPVFYGVGKWVLLCATKQTFGADWTARINANGPQVGFSYQASGGGARATNNFAIGAAFTGEDYAADLVHIAWVSVHQRALPNNEIMAWWQDIIDNDGVYVAPSGGAPAHRWNLTGTPGATLVDLEGSEDLTRTGSAATLTSSNHRFVI